MSSTPPTDDARLQNELRQFLTSLRNDLDVLRGAQTATNAVLHAVLATHTNPKNCEAAVAQMVEQLARDSQKLPERSLQAMNSTIASLRITIDRNLKHRQAQQAASSH